jgi:hypothetical protein
MYIQHVRGRVTKFFSLTNLNKYLYNDVSEIKVNININNGSKNYKKTTAIIGELIIN